MDNTLRTDLLPASLPLFWLAVAAILATALWVALHVTFIRQQRKPAFSFLFAFPVGAMAFWLLLQLGARLVFIASPWPLWGLALLSAAACEATVWIYHHERMLCRPRLRRTMLLLRLVAVATVCLMLVQPVLQREKQRRIRRRVVVLVDDSQSMHRPDTFWTMSERLDMAQAIGELPAARRPLRLAPATNQVFRTRFAYWTERLAAPESAETIERQDTLYDDAAAAARWAEDLGQALAALPAPDPLPQDLRADHDRLKAFQHLLTNQVASAMNKLAGMRPDATPGAETQEPSRDVKADLDAACAAVDKLQAELPDAHRAADVLLQASLDEATRHSISNACATSRVELARQILAGNRDKDSPSLAERLGRRYDLDFYSFASTPLRIADPKAWLATPGAATTTNVTPAVIAERAETDITRAIEKLIQEIPSEERAGMLLLTDGRHTGDAGVEAVARVLGQARTPVSTILVGGTDAPFDFAIASVRSRESVFLGDRVRVDAVLAATGATDVKTQVALLRDGKSVATKDITIQGVDWQEEIRLEDMPEERGTYRYEVKIESDPREILLENNTWSMDVAVSDNRTHVLVVDRRPRWEFRYLRNLFYGRDKSIHLQYFLSEPDVIRGLAPKKPAPPASASREFGDAEASALPTSLEEWRKFDVIILGDVDETVLDDAAVKAIQHCVETRGATLVCIAGPRSMPFAIKNPVFQAMLPIGHAATTNAFAAAPEAEFRVAMTAAGRTHEIMSLSTSQMENNALWNAQPLWRWRLPVEDVKPGAEILAVAAPNEPAADTTFTLDATSGASPEAAVAAFADLRRQEMRQALVVAQPYGTGKVLMLLTDQTWRLRYQVGDTYHHRFWGQIMRWAAGEQLRAGNVYARMGTDRVAYTPGEPVHIRARLSDNQFTPLANLKPMAILANERGDETARIELTYQEGSNGLYEGILQQRLEPGSHHVKLDVPGLGGILGDNLPDNLDCVFSVLTARQPKEAAHVTADERVPRVLAAQSGGKSVSPVEAGILESDFGEPSRIVVETLEIPLWCSPWLFAIILASLTAEWLLRKKGGLT
ncbi:MAG: hypothetical protein GX615_03135 [Lentisphaerae bacterium]|nr:hypothetical protein [Lentisphaerota bacterium]